MSETTTTKAVTPTIMPSKVNAERSLCAQIAATASLRVSMNFTEFLIKPQKARNIYLLPAQGVDRIQARGLPCRPQPEDDSHRRRNPNPDTDGPQRHVGRQR